MPTTVCNNPLDTNDSGDEGITARERVPLIADSQGQVRVTFVCSTTAGQRFKTDHCSIGVQSGGSSGETIATPVELLFSGASGFDLANAAGGTTLVSDWANLSFVSSDNLVVIMDFTAAGSGGFPRFKASAATGCSSVFHLAAASYNSATVPAGSTTNVGQTLGFNLIETTAGGAPITNLTPQIWL